VAGLEPWPREDPPAETNGAMPLSLLGELAALATAACWAGSATFFGVASRRVGSVVLNRVRLLLATFYLLVIHS
jgi:drug/metabolite transporter (DMT)-like permease